MSVGLLADAQLSWFLHRHLDSFTVTGQILPIYRDSTIKTVPSGRDNSRLSIWTLQKLMPTPTQTATTHTTGPLAHIFMAVGLSLPTVLIKLYRDNLYSALLSGPANAQETVGPPAVTINFCHIINCTSLYHDSSITNEKYMC